MSVLLRLASLSTDGTSSSIRLLCHASILSALIYSQVEIRIRQSPISRQVPAKKSIDRAPSAPYCSFNAQSLPGILSRVVIVTEDPPSCFHASFCVGDSSNGELCLNKTNPFIVHSKSTFLLNCQTF